MDYKAFSQSYPLYPQMRSSLLSCGKHPQASVVSICTYKDCNFGFLMCQQCTVEYPEHNLSHQGFIMYLSKFLSKQREKAVYSIVGVSLQRYKGEVSQFMEEVAKKLGKLEEYVNYSDQNLIAMIRKFVEEFNARLKRSLIEKEMNQLNRLKDKLRFLEELITRQEQQNTMALEEGKVSSEVLRELILNDDKPQNNTQIEYVKASLETCKFEFGEVKQVESVVHEVEAECNVFRANLGGFLDTWLTSFGSGKYREGLNLVSSSTPTNNRNTTTSGVNVLAGNSVAKGGNTPASAGNGLGNSASGSLNQVGSPVNVVKVVDPFGCGDSGNGNFKTAENNVLASPKYSSNGYTMSNVVSGKVSSSDGKTLGNLNLVSAGVTVTVANTGTSTGPSANPITTWASSTVGTPGISAVTSTVASTSSNRKISVSEFNNGNIANNSNSLSNSNNNSQYSSANYSTSVNNTPQGNFTQNSNTSTPLESAFTQQVGGNSIPQSNSTHNSNTSNLSIDFAPHRKEIDYTSYQGKLLYGSHFASNTSSDNAKLETNPTNDASSQAQQYLPETHDKNNFSSKELVKKSIEKMFDSNAPHSQSSEDENELLLKYKSMVCPSSRQIIDQVNRISPPSLFSKLPFIMNLQPKLKSFLEELQKVLSSSVSNGKAFSFNQLVNLVFQIIPASDFTMVNVTPNHYYFGHYSNNRRESFGLTVIPLSSIYVGEYKNNVPDGIGLFIMENGVYYDGEWSAGMYCGFGSLYDTQSLTEYHGSFAHGKKDGQGYEKRPDGALYVGAFKDGGKEGKGACLWPIGEKYEGDFKGNKIEGCGVYMWNDGSMYMGDWKNSMMHGKGFLIEADGGRYLGEFKEDMKDGYGSYTWSDGFVYRGGWKTGTQTGIGVEVETSGKQKVGQWKEGDLVMWLE